MSNENRVVELQQRVQELCAWCQDIRLPLSVLFTLVEDIKFEQKFRALSNFYASEQLQKQAEEEKRVVLSA